MHCASVGLVLHWILIKGSIVGDGSSCPSPSLLALDAHSVKLSRQKLGDFAVSDDRLIELHAENKLSKEQLLYLKFPIDDEAPAQVHPEKTHGQVSQGSTAADSAAGDDWVSILLQSVADTATFAPEHGAPNGSLDEFNSGSLPSCGRARDLFPLPHLFDLVLDEISWTPRPSELAFARAAVDGMNYLYAVTPSDATTLILTQRNVLILLLTKVRRMFDRLAKIDRPPCQSDCFDLVVGPTASGGTKPVVKLNSDTCDVLDQSGLVDPLPFLPPDVRRVVSDASLLFPKPPEGLSEYQGIKDADRAEYVRLVVEQIKGKKVGLRRSVRAGGTVFGFGKGY